jgi:hypothetical protein
MANSVIQIKSSLSTAQPPSLNVGELAYSYASNTAFIGLPDTTVIPIGGKFYIDQQRYIYNQANASFITANIAFNLANAASTHANSGFIQANAAFTAVNSITTGIEYAFNTANAAFVVANSAAIAANTPSSIANAAFNLANSAAIAANTPSNVANSAYNQANAAFNRANTSALTVSLTDDANVFSNVVTQVTGLRFDSNSGFDITDLGSGNVKIGMNSTFKYWKIAGQEDLIANGLDTIAFVGSNGVSIRSNTLTDPKSIIFDTKSLFDITNAAFTKANSAAISANTDKTRLTSIDLKQYVQVSNNNISFGTDYSSGGTPSGLTNWNGQGGWNQGFYSDLATTGGTGTGLTVDVAAGGGGYIWHRIHQW